jgi:poly-gamma-glutamate capsule biosynthesis protein CapA/YwtB (metallophosphatase superfamily)
MNRAGYHQWRTSLYAFHADQAGKILREVAYDDATIAPVQSLLRKEKLKSDPDTQTLEDVACLVFLENYLADFAPKHEEKKVIDILRRTWKKMSDQGRAAAIGLPLSPEVARLVQIALSAE